MALNHCSAKLTTALAGRDFDAVVAGARWHLKAYDDGELGSEATSDIARAIGSMCHLHETRRVTHLTHVFHDRNMRDQWASVTLDLRYRACGLALAVQQLLHSRSAQLCGSAGWPMADTG